MRTNFEKLLFTLVSIGLGELKYECVATNSIDWSHIYNTANLQGVISICLDGFQQLLQKTYGLDIDQRVKLQWIASTMRQEHGYDAQWQTARLLAELYHKNNVDMYVMKGFSLSRLYPKPKHRQCTDMDCFLRKESDGQAAYEISNHIAEQNGLMVDRSYYKHSKIKLKGLIVENHQFLLPTKGSRKSKLFEKDLRGWIDDGHNEYIGDSRLKATAPFFDAVYVLAHAQEHFLNEGIVLRHICDWAMVLKAHADKVDWNEWKRVCSEYGMLSFGYAMSRLAHSICGIAIPFECPKDDEADRRLLDDTLYRKTKANKKQSKMQVRIGLVKNMFANSWKYRMFSDTNFLAFCGRRVWGYLFDKDLD